ncbi:MAG: large subunit ribosomal protein L23 [Phenylobacterium sp.]|jgi:large subunit ribosomal protein L23
MSMTREERLFKVVLGPHISEKSTNAAEGFNTVVFKVLTDSTKIEIKDAVEAHFEVEVEGVRTVNVKGKTKRTGQRMGQRKDWKKAYVTLKEGSELDFVGGAE